MIGRTLAHYAITASLGAGGMGEVYRAVDTKLKREVALKILPRAFVDDANRRARFEREAELLASLNHPNIAQIYGIETLDSVQALVIELVDGPTLADRIAKSPIPVDEALAIAGQIADALEAAHGRGIVHRDLKPANIKLRDDGTVKVLDFGIAKAIETRTTGLEAPALTSPAHTEAGIVLGTAAYMAPEQARGRAVDQRADIWALGCILYEMLTGQPTFAGEDRTSTLARVLERQPDTSALPKSLAPSIARTIELCLEKDPHRRVADVRDVRLALAGTFETGPVAAAVAETRRPRGTWFATAAGLVVGGLVVAAGIRWLAPDSPEPAMTRFSVLVPDEIGYSGRIPGSVSSFAVSPDGRQAVIVGGIATLSGERADEPLWLWTLESGRTRALTGTAGATLPFWSADGRAIGFVAAGGTLSYFDLTRGSVTSIPNALSSPAGAAWSGNDDILFANRGGGLSRTTPEGGEIEEVVTGESLSSTHSENPVFLPDRRHFLYYRHDVGDRAASGIFLGDLDAAPESQPREPLVVADDGPVFVAGMDGRNGYLLYVRDSTLIARPLDATTYEVRGAETAVAALPGQLLGGERSVSASRDGSVIVYAPSRESPAEADEPSERPETMLTWVSRDGSRIPFGVGANDFVNVRVSPDNTMIAATLRSGMSQTPGIPSTSIWLSRIDRPGLTQFLAGEPTIVFGWTPDSERVVFGRNLNSAWSVSAAGTGDDPSLLFRRELMPWVEPVDAETYVDVSMTLSAQLETSIGIVSLAGEDPLFTPLIARAQSGAMSVSVNPAANLIAYQSDESGAPRVYAERFPGGGGKVLVSNDGSTGHMPVFSPDGGELYYVRGGDGAMMVVDVVDAAALSFGSPSVLFDGAGISNSAGDGGVRNWDVAPDGRFLMITEADSAGEPEAPESTAAETAVPDAGPEPGPAAIIVFQNLLARAPE